MEHKYEICYFVMQEGYDEGQWETYGLADTLEEAEEGFEDMKKEMSCGDHVDDEGHYIDQMAIYESDANGAQSAIRVEF